MTPVTASTPATTMSNPVPTYRWQRWVETLQKMSDEELVQHISKLDRALRMKFPKDSNITEQLDKLVSEVEREFDWFPDKSSSLAEQIAWLETMPYERLLVLCEGEAGKVITRGVLFLITEIEILNNPTHITHAIKALQVFEKNPAQRLLLMDALLEANVRLLLKSKIESFKPHAPYTSAILKISDQGVLAVLQGIDAQQEKKEQRELDKLNREVDKLLEKV